MDNLTVIGFLSWVTPLAVVGVFSFVGWVLLQKIKKVDTLDGEVMGHSVKIERLEESAVTAEQVRSIIHQSNEPMKTSLQALQSTLSEQNTTMNMVLQQLAERKGYEQAMKEMGKLSDGR